MSDSTNPDNVRDYVVTDAVVDETVAALIAAASTQTRTALNAVLPRSADTGTLPSSIVSSVTQTDTGVWPNPVRVGDGIRWYHGQPGKAYPTRADGLRPGDVYMSVGVIRRCLTCDGVTPTSWLVIYTSTGAPGGIVTTDPGATSPVPEEPVDPTKPTPQMTVRPTVLIGSTGTWSSTGSTSLIEALSDQHVTGVIGSPSTQGGGVALRTEVAPLLMATGNDLLVTLWGLEAPTAGVVSVRLTRNGSAIATAITQPVTTAMQTGVEFRWKVSELPILSSWDGLVVEVTRDGGGLKIMDITVQSVPPVTVTPPPGDPASSSSVFGGVFGSDLRAAPMSMYTTDKRKHLTTAGPVILGCYDDAPMVVVAEPATQRVKITASTSGGNNSTGTGWADSVPIPPTVKTPTNRWRVLVIISPSTDEYWEFVDATKNATTGAWTCTRGGKITKMSTSRGVMPTGTGITGSGLALGATRITLAEARKAKQGDTAAIAHTLGLNLPTNFYAATYYSAPATRTDGTLSAATEEAARKTVPLTGDRVRLRAAYNTSSLTGVARAVAEALKTFGAVVTGGSAKPSIICESGAVAQAAAGIEPWGELLAGQGVDQIMSWLKPADLEFVPAGWMNASTPVSESPMSTTPVVTPTDPTTPTTPPGTPSSARIKINLPAGVKWASGASCRAIEDMPEGMGSPFAQWRGEGAYFARTWWDQPNNDASTTLYVRWDKWHAPIDCGPGFFYRGESMAQAARGDFDARWANALKQARVWWQRRRDPQRMQVFMSPAHEMNGNWYPHSVNSGNVRQFVDAWKRYRSLQLQHFPEAILTFNANRDSVGTGMDWRNMVPGVQYGGGKVTDWVDCGAVDYYNMDPNAKTLDEFNQHALQFDGWGGPKGIERHRQFWEGVGLPMTIPEWSNNATQGDSPAYADGMNQFMRRHAGTGAGQVAADALFNLSSGYSGRYAVYGDDVGSPNFAARYRALTWGN